SGRWSPGRATICGPTTSCRTGRSCGDSVLVEFDEFAQLGIVEFAEPVLAGADHGLGDRAFAGEQLVDAFLQGPGGDQLVDVDGLRLPDAVGPVGGLVLHGRVPPAVVVDDVGGAGQVEAGAAGAQGDEQDRRSLPGLEVVDELVAGALIEAAV